MNNLKKYKYIFWDFDGVIKDSLEIKTNAFYQLFQEYGNDIANKVKEHHLLNGGMSRYEKIPIYLKWSGCQVSDQNIKLFCDNFAKLVIDGVIASPWVEGVENYLISNKYDQFFFIITATPQEEIEYILNKLNIFHLFKKVYGAPNKKSDSVKDIIFKFKFNKKLCLFIGDAKSDLNAAEENGIDFLLRIHELNNNIFKGSKLNKIKDFCYYE